VVQKRGGDSVRFEVYDDAGGGARWRLIASNGQKVATAGESFASTSNAKRAANAFKDNASTSTFEVYEDTGGSYRWRARSSNGQTVASSGEAFSSEQSAERAADNVRTGAGKAEGP
jgi:uncharacterized protein YegP (UPF0339 family)